MGDVFRPGDLCSRAATGSGSFCITLKVAVGIRYVSKSRYWRLPVTQISPARSGHAVPRMRTVHRSADPFRRMQKVLALAQARKVDVILVTELIRWGRSARFAARSYRQNPNLLRLGANVDLRLDAIGRHFEREIERVDALLELKGAVNQRFQIDFSRAHQC